MYCTYEVTLSRLRVTSAAVERQKVLHNVTVCSWPWLSNMHSACAVLYWHVSPVLYWHVSPVSHMTRILCLWDHASS